MIDTHVHLNFEDYIDDLETVILDAEKAGVSQMVVIGIDEGSSRLAIELSKQYPALFASVGVHPSESENMFEMQATSTQFIEDMLKEDKVVAIGECGIDLYHEDYNLEYQQHVFKNQIELAKTYQKPLIIHSRSGVRECIDMLKPYQGQVNGVFHCFNGSKEEANEILELGFYIGVNGPITFKNAKDAKDIAIHVPIEKLLIETDGPYLSPEPYRGRRNQPANVKYILKTLAQLKNMSEADVDTITTQNAKTLFLLP
ncbi:MAG: TatD family hydrolase [Firmicutes bacterium]|nr:TatD family hydrolase [Bacillota bacterium]